MEPLLHVTGTKPIYTSFPSLEHIATVKTAIVLWNRNDIRYLVNQDHYVKYFFYDDYHENYHKYQLEVDAEKLRLPEKITRNLKNVVRRIGEEIYRWMGYHERKFRIYKNSDYKVPFPTELCWTTLGAIDWSKTAQAIVKDANLPIDLRYKLACNYCFEDDVLGLRNVISELSESTGQNKKRRKLENEANYPYSIARADRWLKLIQQHFLSSQVTHVTLQFMWYVIAGKKASPADMLQQEASSYVMQFLTDICRDDNKAALKYLYPYLTEDLRNRMWKEISNDDILNKECFFYLLSLMDETQQASFFQKSEYDSLSIMLCYCMCWPHQDSFMPVANCLMPMASPDDFLHVLQELAAIAERDYQAPRLFAEFWKAGSDSHRQHVIEQCGSSSLLIDTLFKRLHKSDCGGCIGLIWNDCSAENKMDILNFFKRTAHNLYKLVEEAMKYAKNVQFEKINEAEVSIKEKLSFLHFLIEMLERAG